MHALIVGAQGVGKSTLIERVLRELNCSVAGFRTKKEDALAEPENGSPVYFYALGAPKAQTPENRLGYCKSRRAAAFAAAFDRAAPCVEAAAGELILMDEIGVMETGSARYCAAVLKKLDGAVPVLAAVKDKASPFLDAVRTHPNCRCFFITEENRDALAEEVLELLRAQLKG